MATKPADNDQWLSAEQLRKLTAADPDADAAPAPAPQPSKRRPVAWAGFAALLVILVLALLVF